MNAPLVYVTWRTPKLGQTCILECGHYYHHDVSHIDCGVQQHRCKKCQAGVSPDAEAVMAEGGPEPVVAGELRPARPRLLR